MWATHPAAEDGDGGHSLRTNSSQNMYGDSNGSVPPYMAALLDDKLAELRWKDTLNDENLSPLTLSAKRGNRRFFAHLTSERAVLFQRIAHVTQFLFPLDGVDLSHHFFDHRAPGLLDIAHRRGSTGDRESISRNSSKSRRASIVEGLSEVVRGSGPQGEGAIFHLCYQGHLGMLTPQLRYILKIKWERFGRPVFWMRSIQNACFIVLFSAWSLIPAKGTQAATSSSSSSSNSSSSSSAGALVFSEAGDDVVDTVLAVAVWVPPLFKFY